MNVLFLTTHLNTGGITSYLYTLAKGMREEGFGVSIGSSGGNRESDFSALGVKHLKLNIKTKSELDPRIYLALKEVKQYIAQEEIDIVHSQTRITQVMGHLLKKSTGIPYVSTCHGYFKTRLSRRIFPCWGEKVIAISDAVKEHLVQDFKVDAKCISTIESGIDLDLFTVSVSDEKKSELKKKLGLESEFVVGQIARLSDVNGQDILIKAFASVKQDAKGIKLLLIGEGREEGYLKKLVKELKLTSHVIFQPTIDDRTEAMNIMDLFVMPSRKEGLGLSAMEAQACGLCVVAANVGGLPSLIESGQTGFLFEPENDLELGELINSLASNKAKVKSVGENASKAAQQRYAYKNMVAKTIDFYKGAKGS